MEGTSRSDPVSLLSLPPEIQAKIYSCLAQSFEQSAINAVLRTCKQLYEIALPIPRNVQFLRYILIRKPELSKYVKTVILGSFSPDSPKFEHPRDTAHPNDTKSTKSEVEIFRETIQKKLGQFGLERFPWYNSWVEEWLDGLAQGTTDAQTTLILLICPNIRTLLFERPRGARIFIRFLFVVDLLWNAIPGGHYPEMPSDVPLLNVQDVYHEANVVDIHYKDFASHAQPIFFLPRLQFYECNLAFGGDGDPQGLVLLNPRSSPIEEIVLRASAVSGPVILAMLKACKALKKLEYTQLCTKTAYSGVSPQQLAVALLLHADTLEDLFVNFNDLRDKRWEWEGHTDILSSQMPLRVEEAPSLIECLPESLEYLKIVACGEEIQEKAAELLRTVEKRQGFTKLAYIGFFFNRWLMKSEIDLRCGLPSVQLDIRYQDREEYSDDLARPACESGLGGVRNQISRIYGADARQNYLSRRRL
uniref:F-box domain-containing protein n=1 Tax=Bionectria ochroleuca TaxID=29856 RepID=A0A8H7K7H5_BIOOC